MCGIELLTKGSIALIEFFSCIKQSADGTYLSYRETAGTVGCIIVTLSILALQLTPAACKQGCN